MTKILKTLFILLFAHSSWLTAQNSMSLTSAEGRPDDVVTIELSVSNTDSFVAFQTEIPLGVNLTYVANSAVLYRGTDHQLVASVVDGTLKLYAFSFSGQAFTGNDGKIASFQLKLGKEPGSFPLAHTKAKLVDAAGNALQLTTYDGSVSVVTPKAEITAPQIDFGHIPIRSSYNKTLYVKNVGNEPLTISELLFSDATLSCPSFEERVVNAGNTVSFTIVYSPTVAGSVSHKITVVSDASNGNQVATVTADPYSVNELHLARTNGYCDSIIDFAISVNNMDAITGFQFYVKMPSALQYQSGSFELSSRKTNHICSASMRNDTLVVMAYSPSNTSFTGEDGVIANIKLKIKGNSGTYYLYPKNTILVNAKGENVLSDDYYGYVSVSSPKINVSSTYDFVSSSVTDVITENFLIRNNGNAPLRIDSVLFRDEYLTCDTEFPLVINNYSSANISLSCNRKTEGNFSSYMRIYSNDPTSGLVTIKIQGNRYEPNGLEINYGVVPSEKYLDISIDMNNYSEITAIQAEFSYPNEYYTLRNTDITLAERCQGFSLTSVPVNDSTFKIIMFSMNNSIVSGNEGAVFNIRLSRKDDAANETATVSVKNIILSDVKGNNKDSEGDKIKATELIATLYPDIMNVVAVVQIDGEELAGSGNNVVFELKDSYGDGWNRASLTVSYSDGTPSQNIGLTSGYSTKQTITINPDIHVTITFNSGSYDSECSFSISYENGNLIYQSSGKPSAGVVCEFDTYATSEYSPEFIKLNAYCNDEYRGGNKLVYESDYGRYYLYLTIYGEANDIISFKLYDDATSSELDEYQCGTIVFEPDVEIGTLNEPHVFNFMSTVIQERKLVSGWNWFSTNIDVNGEEGFEMLKRSLGNNAIVIKSQTEFTKYYEEYEMWSGSLETIDNDNLYKINMQNEHTIMMTGVLTDVANFSKTLMPGWNWISYPLDEEMNLNEIDFGFTPKQGDYIKSQEQFSKYYEGYGWSGSLEVLKPGEGYIYNNTDEIEKTLSYSRKK